jgi:hypothetical protein
MADYKTQLHEAITQLQVETKRGELPRSLRFAKIEELAEDYFDKTGEWPDIVALERMTTLCLHEELTDSNPDKITNEEYPIMSETQLARRREGKHRKKEANYRIEVPLGIADNYGTDGRMHEYPTRRVRSERENSFVDKEAKARNEERRDAYNAFVNGKASGLFSIDVATGEKNIGGVDNEG